jgi:hypothetical protein
MLAEMKVDSLVDSTVEWSGANLAMKMAASTVAL